MIAAAAWVEWWRWAIAVLCVLLGAGSVWFAVLTRRYARAAAAERVRAERVLAETRQLLLRLPGDEPR